MAEPTLTGRHPRPGKRGPKRPPIGGLVKCHRNPRNPRATTVQTWRREFASRAPNSVRRTSEPENHICAPAAPTVADGTARRNAMQP